MPAQDVQVMDAEPLKLGASANVRGKDYEVVAPLGQGSFGIVWAAKPKGEKQDAAEVALKEIFCKSQDELDRVVNEGYLLGVLSRLRGIGVKPSSINRMPTLVALQVDRLGFERWRVLIAMSKLPGEPLESYLERRTLPGTNSSTAEHCNFAEACSCAGELLVQLAPALYDVSACVYHRDVTPRNILVDELPGGGGRLIFSLVDFGLAVDAAMWRSDRSGGDLGGDGRYWPTSSWFAFGYGVQELEKHPTLRQEYRTCLDNHALGLSALRCLMELMPWPEAAEESPQSHEDEAAGLAAAMPKLNSLRSAWTQYWADARRFWQPVYDFFRVGGDFDALRASYVRKEVHAIISADLRAVRHALAEAREACSKAPLESGLARMPALFDALLLMVSPGLEHKGYKETQLDAEAKLDKY